MQAFSRILTFGALTFLPSACGSQPGDRAVSGAGNGALGAAVLGADPVTGAVIGGVVGGVTNNGSLNPGRPIRQMQIGNQQL